MTRTADVRVRSARVIAAAVAAGLLAVVALVAPLSTPANAATIPVLTVQDFYDAIDEANLADEMTTISIMAPLVFPSLDITPVLTADVYVIIDSSSNTMSCAEANTCDTWLDVSLASTGELSVVATRIEGFQHAVTVSESDVTFVNVNFTGNGVTTAGPIEAYGAALYVINNEDSLGPEFGQSLYDVNLSNVTFEDNFLAVGEGGAVGGAVYIEGDVTISGSHFISNSVAVANNVSFAFGGGLALANSAATISSTDFFYNSASTDIGDAGDPTDFNVGGGAISILGTYLTLLNTDVNFNESDGAAGGIYVTDSLAIVEESELTDNDASYGGAMYIDGGEAHVLDSTVDANSATAVATVDIRAAGGAVMASNGHFVTERSLYRDNEAPFSDGGAIALNSATGTIEASLLTGNSAVKGGAVYVFDTEYGAEASTFTDNRAESGSAIFVEAAALYSQHLTIARNTATGTDSNEYPGQLSAGDGALVDLQFSVLDEPLGVGDNCAFDGTQNIESDFNVVNDESCELIGSDDLQDFDLNIRLGLLQFNGGPTWTMMPAQGSRLINFAAGQDCIVGAVDQRDVDRPQGGGCDVGAVETFAPIFHTFVTPGGNVEMMILNATGLLNPTAVPIASLTPAPPAGVIFPYGALDYQIEVWGAGFPVDVEIATPGPTLQLWKNQWDEEWYEYPATRAVYDEYTVWSYRLIDGEDGDEDGDDNKLIVDPIAPGLNASFAG